MEINHTRVVKYYVCETHPFSGHLFKHAQGQLYRVADGRTMQKISLITEDKIKAVYFDEKTKQEVDFIFHKFDGKQHYLPADALEVFKYAFLAVTIFMLSVFYYHSVNNDRDRILNCKMSLQHRDINEIKELCK